MNMKKEYIIYIAVAVVLVIGIAAYLLLNSGSCTACGTQVSSSYLQQMHQIANNNTLASSVGTGLAVSGLASNLPKPINSTPYIVDGKPEVFYVGGDFCPYCAATRWGLVVALMRFGNFTSLEYMESSHTDVYPDTATFSFMNYSYNSKLVDFNGYEIYNRTEGQVNTSITPLDTAIYDRYSQGVPFIDFANSSIQDGALVNPQVFAGLTWDQILAQMSNPSSAVSQAVIGQANVFTAAICRSNQTINMTAPACKAGYLKSLPS
jgi:hypothetical protein